MISSVEDGIQEKQLFTGSFIMLRLGLRTMFLIFINQRKWSM